MLKIQIGGSVDNPKGGYLDNPKGGSVDNPKGGCIEFKLMNCNQQM
jgi:hypothetical protein